ncbi:MAG TPA: amidase [Gammaproteobacteria bacterium]|nr:amidase [Gammaproteobacteria bacterium]
MTFKLEETTISNIHMAIRDGEVSAVDLVDGYLARIATYDKAGPNLNSIITVNASAREDAARLDAAYARTGEFSGPLHGVPIVVKDQAETEGLMTTFGCVAMDGYVPEKDATAIAKLRDAGAIILAKTAMPDFATSWFGYSSMAGETKNPYDLAHDPGGSSGGTGAAVAANLGTIGVGEDTGGSIRLPSSFDNLVGLKVTPGLISRAGMSPLVVFQDSAGPMCRTVEDLARLLNVLVGFDPADPFTATAVIAGPVDYQARLNIEQLKGQTIGVLRQSFGDPSDPVAAEVNALMEQALAVMRGAGANTVDVEIPDLDYYVEYTSLYVTRSRHDIDAFLDSRPVPMKKIKDIYDAGKIHPAIELFEMLVEGPENPLSDPEYYQRYTAREVFQRSIINEMAKVGASTLVFPTTQIPSPSRADLDAGKWTTFTYPTNTLIAAQSWLPAISVPAGFSQAGLPVGIEMMGLPYNEASLVSLAYAFEQLTHHRRPPASTPEI